jgi:hypothetical protein
MPLAVYRKNIWRLAALILVNLPGFGLLEFCQLGGDCPSLVQNVAEIVNGACLVFIWMSLQLLGVRHWHNLLELDVDFSHMEPVQILIDEHGKSCSSEAEGDRHIFRSEIDDSTHLGEAVLSVPNGISIPSTQDSTILTIHSSVASQASTALQGCTASGAELDGSPALIWSMEVPPGSPALIK